MVVMLAVLAILPGSMWKGTRFAFLSDWQWLLAAAALALTAMVHRMGTSTFGRVVRYTRADPDNIAARAAIRDRGLKLLRALHEGPQYKRIVIVAHSLGTILAHDLLSYFWTERDAARMVKEGTPEFDALCRLENAATRLEEMPSDHGRLKDYVGAQRDMSRQLAGRPPSGGPNQPDPRWLISDLVTFGSPLAHSEFLIAKDRADLEARKAARELPQSPPFREFLDQNVLNRAVAAHSMPIASPAGKTRLMSYPLVNASDMWMLHHAAPFAAVRWTNVYDPATLVFFGDVISGPLAPVFGPAIIDVDLRKWRGGSHSWSFTHTKYWAPDEATRIELCRDAVNLLDSSPDRLMK
jgi:hypothetical protein